MGACVAPFSTGHHGLTYNSSDASRCYDWEDCRRRSHKTRQLTHEPSLYVATECAPRTNDDEWGYRAFSGALSPRDDKTKTPIPTRVRPKTTGSPSPAGAPVGPGTLMTKASWLPM